MRPDQSHLHSFKTVLCILDTRTESFHEDDESINTIEEEEEPLGYYNSRKI